jgi:predicted enzyme related to lactoylglutathione lyase
MSRPVVHFEFWTKDRKRCGAFYAKVFGWNLRDIPQMDYTVVDKTGPDGIGGGMFTPKEGEWPAPLSLYIDVEELKPYREAIVANGGKILVEEQEVPGVGSFCLFADPDGRVLGCWKQNPNAKI